MNRQLLFLVAFLASFSVFGQSTDCKKYTVANTNSICNPTTWQPFILRSGNTRFFADQVEFRENGDNTATIKGVGRDETWQPIQFNLTFSGKSATAVNGFPFLTNCLQNKVVSTSAWVYYSSVMGSIIYNQDTCAISGFSTAPLGLQIGVGANTQNDEDLGGFTTLKGQFKQQTTPSSFEMAFKLVSPEAVTCLGGNVSDCTNDTQAPEFANCPKDLYRATTEPLYEVTWVAPTATDNCSTPSVVSNYSSGFKFTTGTNTTVTYTATDAKNNKSTCSFKVNVALVVPVVTNPYCVSRGTIPWEEWIANVTLADLNNPSDKSRDIAGVPFVAGYSDYRDKTATIRQAKTYAMILTPGLSYSANPADLYWRVWIDFNNDKDFNDEGELVLDKPNGNQSLTANITIPANAVIGKTQMRVSAKKGGISTSCDVFDRGEVEDYTVDIKLADPCDIDSKPPVFANCPANVNVKTEGTTATATWIAPTATDSCGAPTLTSNFVPGATFPLGTTAVTYTATDAKGNKAICTFNVIVKIDECAGDKTAPVFSACPQNITITTLQTSVAATWTAPTATDSCSIPTITSNFAPGSLFPIGTTAVVYTAIDAKGNKSTCTFNVIILKDECTNDTEAPKFTNCPQNITVNSSDPTIAVTWVLPTVTDNCKVDSLISNFIPGSLFSVGTTTVTITAKDAKKNQATCTFTVTVKSNTVVNSGDIELTLVANPTTYKKLSNVNFKLTAKNKGTTGFTDIKIQFKHPKGAANGGNATPSVGSWTEFCPNATLCFEWSIPKLDAGITATLDLPLYIQDIDTILIATASLLSSTPTDTARANNSVTITVKPASTTANGYVNDQKANEKMPIVLQSVLPTITEGSLYVKLESILEKDIDFAIYSAHGLHVKVNKQHIKIGDNQLLLNVSQLASGVYWIVPLENNNGNKPLKFVKI